MFVALLASLAALLGALWVPAATAAASSRAAVLNHAESIPTHTYVSPLAATADTSAFGSAWAVYERHNAVGQSLDPTGKLIAVTAKHKTHVFGEVTPDMFGFSLAGRTLTAKSDRNASRVYWWRPTSGSAAGTYSTGTVTTGDHYLGSAPDGWIEINPAGTLYDVPARGGAPRLLGNPFGSASGVSGVSGPTGIVVWNANAIAVVSYASGHVTMLDTSELTNLPGGTNTPICWSASASTVACDSYYFTGEDNSGVRNVFLDPLSGAKSIATTSDCPDAASTLGQHAAWLCDGKLRVLGRHGLDKSSLKVGAWPVAGLGGYLTTNSTRRTGIEVTPNAKTTATVLEPTHEVSEATEFTLSAGSAVWLENAASGATVRRRTLRHNASDSKVTLGPVHRVAASSTVHGELASAGKTFAYPMKLTNSSVGQHGSENLRVVSPAGTVTLHDVDRYLPVSIGDHRVAYYTDSRNARIYDLKTHKTTKLATSGVALSGHWLAWADVAGTISLENLDTGSVRTVASAGQIVGDQLFVHGQVVGWNAYPPGPGGHLAFYRDMASTGSVVQLPTRVNIWQFSDAGMVLERTPSASSSTTPSFPEARAIRFRANMVFLLQAYGASTSTPILSASYPIVGPQVAGGIVAWVDQHGRLKATALH